MMSKTGMSFHKRMQSQNQAKALGQSTVASHKQQLVQATGSKRQAAMGGVGAGQKGLGSLTNSNVQ